MVNADSDLVRAHPEWVLRDRDDLPPPWRHQQVLDLRQPGACGHVRDALLALLDEYEMAFLKWDHNRDLLDVGAAVHDQTAALYALLDEVRAAHPSSRSSRAPVVAGGSTSACWRAPTGCGRATPSTPWSGSGSSAGPRCWCRRSGWARTSADRWRTPPATPHAGLPGRQALLGSFGVEWDLRGLPRERAELAAWVALHKTLRPLLATGRLVRGDHPDPAVLLTGIVAPDRSEAWYVVATIDSTATQTPAPVVLPGLDPARRYAVSEVTPPGHQAVGHLGSTWLDGDPLPASGRALAHLGVLMPVMLPETARVLRVSSV